MLDKGGTVTQLIKSLLYKHEDLGFTPRILSMVAHACNPSAGEMQTADPSLTGESRLMKTLSQKNKLPDLCTHANECMYTYIDTPICISTCTSKLLKS